MPINFRVGQGIDIHPLVKGRKLILGGVAIPFDRGLAGHSDADALTHAIIDALLGAAGCPDIGTRFPDSDAEWKDADSLGLLGVVWSELAARGWQIVNLDCSLVAQAPKVAPYISSMKKNISNILGCPPQRLAIKATTSENLGFAGRGEGIAAMAVVLLTGGDGGAAAT